MANRFIKNNKLREVTIKGYKSIAFDNPVTLKLGDVSILLGANGAGKSNIVSFFRMLSYMMTKSFGRYVEMAGTANSLLHYGAKKTPVMSGTLTFMTNNSENTYQFTLANATPDRLIITEFQPYAKRFFYKYIQIIQFQSDSCLDIGITTGYN